MSPHLERKREQSIVGRESAEKHNEQEDLQSANTHTHSHKHVQVKFDPHRNMLSGCVLCL